MLILFLCILFIILIIGLYWLYRLIRWVLKKKIRIKWASGVVVIIILTALIHHLFFKNMEFIPSKVYPNYYLIKYPIKDEDSIQSLIREMVIRKVNQHEPKKIQFYEYYTGTPFFVPFGEAGTVHFLDHKEDPGGFSSEEIIHYNNYRIAEYNLKFCNADTLNHVGILSFYKNNKVVKTDTIIDKCFYNKSEYVILEFKPEWHWVFTEATSTELSTAELIEIESIIENTIEAHNIEQRQKLEAYNLENSEHQLTKTGYELQLSKGYKRQYVPVINSKGEKEVFVNFFCNDAHEEHWKTEIVAVEDGGTCYFNLKINLQTKAHQLDINYDVDNGFLISDADENLKTKNAPLVFAKIDTVSINEIKRYTDAVLPSIFDYYKKEEEGDYQTWSDKMFGRCCTEADLSYAELLNFIVTANVNNNAYPSSNLSDMTYRTTYAFKESDNVEIHIKLNRNSEYHTYHTNWAVDEVLKPNDTLLKPFRLSLINGYVKSEATFKHNGRVKTMDVFLNNNYEATIALMDTPMIQEFEVDFTFFKNDSIKLVPKSYYKGIKYDDICISEIQNNLGKITHPTINKKYELRTLYNSKEKI